MDLEVLLPLQRSIGRSRFIEGSGDERSNNRGTGVEHVSSISHLLK